MNSIDLVCIYIAWYIQAEQLHTKFSKISHKFVSCCCGMTDFHENEV